MKNWIAFGLVTIGLFSFAVVSAQNFPGLDKSPADIAAFPSKYNESDKVVRVVYGRPQLNGRQLSELAKNGEVWRTGANEAAEITFYKEVNFAGKKVEAGTYSLFTIPGEGEWTVILNRNLNQWGSYFYDQAADYLRVQAKPSSSEESVEAFAIAFEKTDAGADMFLAWGTLRVQVPISW